MLAAPILDDLPFAAGDNVLAFVNGMGGTPLIELYIVFNELDQICAGRGMTIARNLVGNYITSLEMAGCSITLLRLDDELTKLWDAPGQHRPPSAGASDRQPDHRGAGRGTMSTASISYDDVVAWIELPPVGLAKQGLPDRARLRHRRCRPRHQHGPRLPGRAAKLPALPHGDIGGLCKAVGMTLMSTVGGASGPLYGTFFLRIGAARPARPRSTSRTSPRACESAIEAIQASARPSRRQDHAGRPHPRPRRAACGARRRRRSGAMLLAAAVAAAEQRHGRHDPARRPQGPGELPRRAERGSPGPGRNVLASSCCKRHGRRPSFGRRPPQGHGRTSRHDEVRRRPRPGHHQHPLHDLRPRRPGGRDRPEGARADLPEARLGRARPDGDLEHARSEVIKGALAKAGISAADLAAVGITNQRETTRRLGPDTGKPVYNAIVWQDTRTDRHLSTSCAKDGGQDRFRAKAGLPLATYFSGPKVRWILDNVDRAPARRPRPATSSSATSTPGASGT